MPQIPGAVNFDRRSYQKLILDMLRDADDLAYSRAGLALSRTSDDALRRIAGGLPYRFLVLSRGLEL